MMRMFRPVAFVLALSVVPLQATAAAPAPLRVAYLAAATSPCAAPAARAPAGLRAYVDHLSKRLERTVLACAFATAPEASVALADGRVDMAPLSPILAPERLAQVRPLLTPRAAGGVGRVLTVLVSKAGGPFDSLERAAGARLVLAGTTEVARGGPLRALEDHGVSERAFKSETVGESLEAAVAILRAGKADVLLTYAAAWQRLCRGDKPDEKPCADLREVWRGRPDVDQAWAIRRDMADELRLRIVGIHVSMNLEAPAAFQWMAPGAGELQPVEATARVRAPAHP